MANRVKGITIEIDGNTTELQKSLSDVDSKLKDTQTKLKDVNKLLKFDPKNTELLRQKQDLLNKAIKDTEDREKKLKEAYEEALKAGDTDEARAQQDAIQRELIETQQNLKKLQTELDNMAEKAESDSERAQRKLKEFGDTAQKVSDKTRALSMGAAAVGTAMVGMAYNAGRSADDLLTLSRNTGFSVEELQKMQYASDLVDVSMDQMTGSIQKLTKQMGSGNKAFETLGVSITDENGNMRDAVDVWYESLEALSQVENSTLQDQLAMELFGRSAMEMSGIIDDGGESLKQLGQDAEDMGLILGTDAVQAAGEFNDAMDELKNQAQQAFFEAGAALAESLMPMLEELISKVSEVIQWFSDLDGDTQILILTILGLVAAISPVAGLISGIITVTSALAGVFAFICSPIGLVVAAIAGLIAIGITLYKNWDTIKEKAGELWSAVTEKFEAIKNAIGEKIESAKNKVSDAIQAIKNLFNFKVSWPHIPLPHFSVTGSANPLDWLKQGVPRISISWYAKAMQDGMILNSPTIFGYQNGRYLGGGEAGAEVVVGAGSLYSMIQSAVGRQSVTAPINLSVTVNGNVDDSDRFARQLGDRLANIIERNSEVFR